MLDRETGESLYPIKEKEYPASDLPGEETYPTQPLPLQPPPFARQRLGVEDINPHSPDKDSLIAVLERSRSAGQFVPPSREGTIIFPGFDGGGEWGGAAYDPEAGVLYVNANEMPWILTMVEVDENKGSDLLALGKSVFQANCMSCHGADLKGSTFHGTAPSLVGLSERLSDSTVTATIRNGRGAMPAFSYLKTTQIEALTAFLLGKANRSIQEEQGVSTNDKTSVPFKSTGYNRFVDSEGYPAVKPPWGTLNAIDLNSGSILWQVPLGEYKELSNKGMPITGTENYGGPIVTAGGLIFIGATKDEYFRAFDQETGAELWKYKLPAAGMATPCTYEVNEKQYVVIAAGGGKNVAVRGDAYVAFSIPDK